MDVSVVICTFNRAPLLQQTLEGLVQLEIPVALEWEVVVVDNASTDGTAQLLASFVAPYHLRCFREDRPGQSSALNRALRESRSDLVLFTDDDVLVDAKWLSAFVDAARRHPDAAIFGGPVEPWFPSTPNPHLLAAFPALEVGFAGVNHNRPEGDLPAPLAVVGANMAMRVSTSRGLSYDENLGPGTGVLGGGEIDLQKRLRDMNAPIVWVPDMRVRHYVEPARMTLNYLLTFAESVGMTEIRRFGIPGGRPILGIPVWLIQSVVAEWSRAATSGLLGDRKRSLTHRRRSHEFIGRVKECRRIHRAVRKGPAMVAARAIAPGRE